MEVRAAELFAHAPGVLDTEDIEVVHDMRVASRRLRAVLEIFASCFPADAHRAALRDVKALADALGHRRDPDVAIAALEEFAKAAPDADRPGIEHLIQRFGVEQRRGNETLVLALRRVDEDDLAGRLQWLVEAAQAAAQPPVDAPATAEAQHHAGAEPGRPAATAGSPLADPDPQALA